LFLRAQGQRAIEPQSQEIEVNVQSVWSKHDQLEDLFHFMLLAADVAARTLF